MSDWVQIAEILAALVGGGALLKLGQFARDTWAQRRREKREEALLSWPMAVYSVSSIYEQLALVIEELPGSTRALVLVAWPEQRDWSSVLYEQRAPSMGDPIRGSWQRVRLDDQYRSMLETVVAVGHFRNDVATMPHGQLRDQYVTDGVLASDVALIADDWPDVLVYMSVTWAAPPEKLDVVRGIIARHARAIRSHLAPQIDLHLAPIRRETTEEVPR